MLKILVAFNLVIRFQYVIGGSLSSSIFSGLNSETKPVIDSEFDSESNRVSSFDCDARKVLLEYAYKIQPWLNDKQSKVLEQSLLCNSTRTVSGADFQSDTWADFSDHATESEFSFKQDTKSDHNQGQKIRPDDSRFSKSIQSNSFNTNFKRFPKWIQNRISQFIDTQNIWNTKYNVSSCTSEKLLEQSLVFVDYKNGKTTTNSMKDTESDLGCSHKPFKLIQDAVKFLRVQQLTTSTRNRRKIIYLRGSYQIQNEDLNKDQEVTPDGIHYLPKTINLTAADGPISIIGAQGENVWLSGGILLSALRKKQDESESDSDKQQYESRWKPSTKYGIQNVYETSLNNFVSQSGYFSKFKSVTALNTIEPYHRLPRARHPNFVKKTDIYDYSTPSYLDQEKTIIRWIPPSYPYSKLKPEKTIFIDLSDPNITQTIPSLTGITGLPLNTSTQFQYNSYTNAHGGLCNRFTPAESYWCSKHAYGGAAEDADLKGPLWPIGVVIRNDTFKNHNGNFMTNLHDIQLHVFRDGRWHNEMYDIENVTVSSHDSEGPGGDHIRFDFYKNIGGNQGARGWPVTSGNPGPEKDSDISLKSDDWFLENYPQAMDSHGEWYYSKEDQKLYLYVEDNNSSDTVTNMTSLNFNQSNFQDSRSRLLSQDLIIPQLKTLFSIKDGNDIEFINIGFRDTIPTFMEPHAVPSGGDWSLQKTAAFFVQNSTGLHIKNCRFRGLDGNGLMLYGTNRDTVIEQNEFSFIGDTAMIAWGKTDEWDGRRGEQTQNTKIIGNFVHDIGYYQKQSAAWFQAKTMKTTISKNIFFNGPRSGINFNDGFGGGHVVKHNVLFNMCRETADHGPINMWNRIPYAYTKSQSIVTDTTESESSFQPMMSLIMHNAILANGRSMASVDTDDGTAYWNITNNFFPSSGGLKMDFGGHTQRYYLANIVMTVDVHNQNTLHTALNTRKDTDISKHISNTTTELIMSKNSQNLNQNYNANESNLQDHTGQVTDIISQSDKDNNHNVSSGLLKLKLALVRWWLKYLKVLERKPLQTKTVTAAFCGVISEMLVSKIAADGRSLFRGCIKQVALSFIFRGPVMHYWTTWLNDFFLKRRNNFPPNTLKTTLGKVAVHESIYDPFFVICFLFLLRLWDSKGDIKESWNGATTNFKPALKTQYSIWPLVQVVNYRFVPPQLQVLFISVVAICTNAYLTYLSKSKTKS